MRASIVVLIVLGVVGSACRRARESPDQVERTAEERERTVLLARDERQFQETLRKLRDAAARAESVEIYHVANQFDADYAQIAERTEARFANYPIRKQITVSKERFAPIVNVLSERASYFPAGEVWTCLFEPRHILHFAAQGVTAIVCIECGDVELMVGKESIGTHSVRPAANGELTRMLTSMFGAGG